MISLGSNLSLSEGEAQVVRLYRDDVCAMGERNVRAGPVTNVTPLHRLVGWISTSRGLSLVYQCAAESYCELKTKPFILKSFSEYLVKVVASCDIRYSRWVESC